MIRADMKAVLQVEADADVQDHWQEEDFLKQLRQRNSIGMIAERGDKLLGFMVYALEKSHLDVLRFAVAPEAHRTGVGRAMVDKLMGKLSPHRRTRIVFDVPEEVLPLQLFLRRVGLRAVRLLRSTQEIRFVYRIDSEDDSDAAPGHNRIAGLI